MRKLAAIMFTDIVGYTALMGEDEPKALQLLQKNREILKPIIKQFHGEWLKEMGDSGYIAALEAFPHRRARTKGPAAGPTPCCSS